MRPEALLFLFVFSFASLLLACGCSRPLPAELVLNDFESDADLNRIHWGCRSLFSLSEKHATSGARALEMKLFPAAYPPYEERFQGRFSLLPGANRVRIPLDTLKASGTGRPLNLKTIKRFMWFLVDTKDIYTFYVDHIRLAG